MSANEIIFRNGTVFDGRRSYPGQSVRVRGGRITAVAGRIAGLPHHRPEAVDLDGGTLLPGFIDAHVHPLFAGEQLRRCDLRQAWQSRGVRRTRRRLRQGPS